MRQTHRVPQAFLKRWKFQTDITQYNPFKLSYHNSIVILDYQKYLHLLLLNGSLVLRTPGENQPVEYSR
jgi:hypothetical protein